MSRGKVFYNKLLLHTISIINTMDLPTLLANANPDTKTPEGLTALHILAQHGYPKDIYERRDIAKAITKNIREERFYSQSPEFYTTSSSDEKSIEDFKEKVRLLVAAKLSVDAEDSKGLTPMHYAASHSSLEVSSKMIEILLPYSKYKDYKENKEKLEIILDRSIQAEKAKEIAYSTYKDLYDFYDECHPEKALKKEDSPLSTSDYSEHSKFEKSQLSASGEVAEILSKSPPKRDFHARPLDKRLSHDEIKRMISELEKSNPDSSEDITGGSVNFSDVARSSDSLDVNTSDLISQLSDAGTPYLTGTDDASPFIFSASSSDELRKTTTWTKEGIKKPSSSSESFEEGREGQRRNISPKLGSFVERLSPTRAKSTALDKSLDETPCSSNATQHPDNRPQSAAHDDPRHLKSEQKNDLPDDLLKIFQLLGPYDINRHFTQAERVSHTSSSSTIDLDASSSETSSEQEPKVPPRSSSYSNLLDCNRRLQDAINNPDSMNVFTKNLHKSR